MYNIRKHCFYSFSILLLICFNTFSQDPNFHIYLCFGQSNMAGAGSIEAQDKTVDDRFQVMQPMDCSNLSRSFGKWYLAIPPLWGCNGGLGPSDYFGRTMVKDLPSNIKVGVIVVAIPGCDIALFGTTGYQGFDTYNYVPSKYSGSAYAWLMELAKLAQEDGVIKGILLHQGESNSGQRDWPNKVKGVYDNLIKDLDLVPSQTPLLVGELLYVNQGGACGGHNSVIATVPNVIPNSYVISAEGLTGKDQFHFTTVGNRSFGTRYAEKMLTLLPTSAPPSVSITEPSGNDSFTTIGEIKISANASDSDGSVAYVQFFDGLALLGSDSTAPYSITWSGMESGSHSITAKATDDHGVSATSTPVVISVEAEQAPYNNTIHQIPSRIEAEEYDLGGEGAAYHEENANGNEGNAFMRNDQVDIETTGDTSGLYNVSYIMQGEWLEYTVNVKATGTYDIDLRLAANGDGKSLHIEMDGVNVSESVDVPNTGDWQSWTTITMNDINLIQGQHVMRITFDANYMNLNYMEFKGIATGLKFDKLTEKISSLNSFSVDGLKIKLKGDFNYRITTINGAVKEIGKGSGILPVGTNLTPGIYLISVENSRSVFTKKILKK